jgi:probable F420-dependent oxidoreductase
MRFGTYLPCPGPCAVPSGAMRFAREIEAMGFDYLKTGEHLAFPRSVNHFSGKIDLHDRQLEMFTTFAYLAAGTTTLRFQSGVTLLPLRDPHVLAGLLGSLDTLSEGRVTMEFGLGWMPEEYDVLGVPWHERGAISDEYLAVIRLLFDGGGSFAGKYASFEDVVFPLRPVQDPFPIYIGSMTAAEPVLRRIATYAQGWNLAMPPKAITEALPRLRVLLAERGRADDELAFATAPLPFPCGSPEALEQSSERLAQLRDLGYTEVVVDVGQWDDRALDEILADLTWFADNVMAG